LEIYIKKLEIDENRFDKDMEDATGVYTVKEKGKEFKIVCRFNKFISTISISGKKGTLHINDETHQVVRQVINLSDACGLNVTEEPVEDLSTTAIKGIIFAEKEGNIKELVIKT